VTPGTVVVREGQEGKGLYLILTGEVDVTKVDGSEKVLLATLRAGDCFGEISLIKKSPTTATVTAARHTTILFLRATPPPTGRRLARTRRLLP